MSPAPVRIATRIGVSRIAFVSPTMVARSSAFFAAGRSIVKQTTQMGEMEVTQLLSNYKDFGGIKRASTTSFQMMGQEIRTTVNSWEWDTVKPEEMEPPADIKALLKKPN